ncbi:MAG: YlmH/Sll1252 family protein [Defluviitaleaceae bacterium]|nr:YlmH/Sll1252 family protein [Defluviitaleaceae bacterium]
MYKRDRGDPPDKDEILRELTYHIKKPDGTRFLLAKALNQVYLCFYDNDIRFTDFFDPISAQALLGAASRVGVSGIAFGGYDGAERVRIRFPDDCADDFPIARIMVNFDKKFAKNLSHRDFLGAIIGLGIERHKLGDIVLTVAGAVLFVAEDIAAFILENLDKIGRVGVKPVLLGADEDVFGLDNREAARISVASLRLDCVLAAAFGVSRREAAQAVSAGRAFVNWQSIDNLSRPVQEGDIITLRKFGRIRINNIGDKSRKDKIYVEIIRY